MTIREILEELDKLGVTLRHDGKQMTLRPINKVPPDLLIAIREHKALLERAYTSKHVQTVIEATKGRILDVEEIGTDIETTVGPCTH